MAETNTTQYDLSFSIVWSPLPPITYILPFIGHTGIADSRGVVSDFQGPYTVGDRGRMAFGAPTRALKIRYSSPDSSESCDAAAAAHWDEAIREANTVYRGRVHNIFCDNCHSHVAYALNRVAVKDYGVNKWNMVNIAVLMFFRGHSLSWCSWLQTYGPFLFLLIILALACLVRT